MSRLNRFLLLCFMVFALCACSTADNTPAQKETTPPPPEQEPESTIYVPTEKLVYQLGMQSARRTDKETIELIHAWYIDYITSRIVGLSFPERESLAYGPWEAWKDYGVPDAAEDGSLTEWAEDYYITHDWSPYGEQILTMEPQDQVTINNRTFVVENAFDYPKDSFLEEVRELAGSDTIVVQTCEPNSDLNRILYGHII